MSRNKQRKRRHSIKRLQHNHRHDSQMINFPCGAIDENFLNKSSTYVKYFDYSFPELLADHSSDPMQNTTRKHISSDISNEDRFLNHQMIIRRNGESIIHRPKQDIVLVNGFTSIIRPSSSSLLESHQSVPSQSQIVLSSSIINKMSVSKSEQMIITKRKRKKSIYNNQSESTFKQIFYNIMEEVQQPVPLMSISVYNSSNNHRNQSLIEQLEDICFNRNIIPSSTNDYMEFSYDIPLGDYCNFAENTQIHNDFSRENVCLSSLNDNYIPSYMF